MSITPDTNQPAGAPPTLTRVQKALTAAVSAGAIGIAAIGFAGSYTAVTRLAAAKGFGWFASYFTLGVDLGIGIFLALDLLLTWLRMPYPLLRYGAWILTAATISFNGAAAWPDPLGVGMHATIPLLFVIAVEAARHAVGRIAHITADTHYENPPVSRWLLALPSTFRLYRWMRTRGIRSYTTALERRRRIDAYKAQLRKEHGRRWRRNASPDELLTLALAEKGIRMEEAVRLPQEERTLRTQAALDAELDEERAAEERQRQREAAAEEAARLREQRAAERAAAEAERARAEAELTLAEGEKQLADEEIERRRRIAAEREEAEKRRIAEETAAALAETNRRNRIAEEETERQRRINAAREDAEKFRLAEEARAAAAITNANVQTAQQAATLKIEQLRQEKEEADRKRKEEEAERQRKQEEANRRAKEAAAAVAIPRTSNQRNAKAEPARSGTSTPNPGTGTANPNLNLGTGTSGTSGTTDRNLATGTSGTSNANLSAGTSNQTPARRNTAKANPANLPARATAKQQQIEKILQLIDDLGYDEASLGRVVRETGMSKTTAYHRLTDARAIWNQRQAS